MKKNDCIEYVKNNESILKNGYYHEFDGIILLTYNSGGKDNLPVHQTVNMRLADKLSELLKIDQYSAFRIMENHSEKAKRFHDIEDAYEFYGKEVIIADRDRIVCHDIKEFKEGGSVGGGTPPHYRMSSSRLLIPDVRGGWTKEKIIKYLKSNSSDSASTYKLLRYISEFDSWQTFKDHIYYHGTSNYIEGGLKPSITMSEREAERSGGGGYGQRYFGISLTKRKRTAESFSGTSNSVTIYPVILKRDAKVIERTDLQDASDVEDIIVELYEKGVDAVWIGGGEEELVVVNPYSILFYERGREHHGVFGGFKSIALTDDKIKEIYANSLILADKFYDEYKTKTTKEERNDLSRNFPSIKFKEGGEVSDEMENFDWNSIYDIDGSHGDSDTKKEPKYDIDKIKSLIDQKIDSEKAVIEDWSNRNYKSNKGIVYTGGDDIHGTPLQIGSINESRRRNKINSAERVISELSLAKDIVEKYRGNESDLYNIVLDDYRKNYYRGYKPSYHKRDYRAEQRYSDAYDLLINIVKESQKIEETKTYKEEGSGLIEFNKDRVLVDGKDLGLLEFTKKDNEIEIDKLYLAKENQKSGIGRKIIEKLFNENLDVEKILVYPLGTSEPFWVRFTANVRKDGYFEITRKSFEEGSKKHPLKRYTNPDIRFKEGGEIKTNKITLLKNKTKAPSFGDLYGQDVEPSGYYAIEKRTDYFDNRPNYETVTVEYEKPLIVPVTDDTLTSWKYDLSKKYKAKGKKLTLALIKEGYDIIITKYAEGDTGEIIVLDTNKIKPILRNGGEVSSSNKIFGASSRQKPKETIHFDPPLVGTNGNKLISYTWSYEWTMLPNYEGELVGKRISNWDNAIQNAETGRDIVHQYTVELKDGELKTVSSETVPVLLGLIEKEQKKVFGNLATASKTLAKQQMKLAILQAQQDNYDALRKKYSQAKKPEIEIASWDDLPYVAKKYTERQEIEGKGSRKTYFKMGDIIFSQESVYNRDSDTYTPAKYPDSRTVEQLNWLWEGERIKEEGGEQPYGLYDLKKRVERQKKKVETMLSQKMEEGGEVESNKHEELPYGEIIIVEHSLKSGANVRDAYITVRKDSPFVIQFKNRHVYCLKFRKINNEEWTFYNVAVGFTKKEFDELKEGSIKHTMENTMKFVSTEKRIIEKLLIYELDYLSEKGYVLAPLFIDTYGTTYSVEKLDDDGYYFVNESFTKRGKQLENNNPISYYADTATTVFEAIDKKYKKAKEDELSKGTKVELEHKDTIEEIASGKLTTEQAAEKIAEDHIAEDPAYYDKLAEIEGSTEKPLNFRPIFWQMTMDEFCEYAENHDVDTRLDGTKARLECKDFYKYVVIKPLLHESAERNVFLLAIESNQLPYDKAVEIIKSANAWDENNKFIKQLLQYNHLRNFSANIWKQPKDVYLSSDYFKNNLTRSQADKWYAKQIYKDAILDDRQLHEFLAKGIVKFSDVQARMNEGNVNITTADKRYIDRLKRIADKFSVKLKLKGLYVLLDDELVSQEVTEKRYDSDMKKHEENIEIHRSEYERKKALFPENQRKFVDKLIIDIQNGIEYNKSKLEKLAKEYGINEQNLVKELAELSIVFVARKKAHTTETPEEKFQAIKALYGRQANMSHRTSESILFQQYSTPVTLGYLMGIYCGVDKEGSYFEPSAGNGALTIAGNVKDFTVNEIDSIRNRNLDVQGFKEVLKQDASEPFKEFEKKFDAVLTNPPFGKTEVVRYGNSDIKSLEQVMALRALETMKDNGKAAIIIGGHQQFDSEGRIQAGKNRTFFVYLYKHYNVEDVINISGRDLYSRQGTSFNTRIILINGRKETPSGFPPIIDKPIPMNEPNSPIPVNSFDVLWDRVFGSKN